MRLLDLSQHTLDPIKVVKQISYIHLSLFLSVVLSAIFSSALFVFSSQLSEIMFHDAKYEQLVQLAALDVFFLEYIHQAFPFLTLQWISLALPEFQ